jgi:hypothetical protein
MTASYSSITTGTDEVIRSFASTTPKPDITSPEFYQVIDSGSTAPARIVVINGIDLVFDSSVTGGLWSEFNNSSNIATFIINARTVTFKSPTAIKGANVTITANELHFIGGGSLATTPVTPQPMLTTGANGTPGSSGGNVTLQIGAFFSDPATPFPLILTGGAGGAPGPGAAGAAGVSLAPALQEGQPSAGQNGTAGVIPDNSQVCVDYQATNVKKQDPIHIAFYPSNCPSAIPGYPTNGQDALPGGIPGIGGAGGNLSSTVNVVSSAIQAGGNSAASAGTYAGGQAGTPTVSAWATVKYNADGGPYWSLWPGTSLVYTQNGQNAVSPAASAPHGSAGTYTTLPSGGGWATYGYGAQRLAYATALYTSNYFALATTELQSLATDLTNSAITSDATGDISALIQQINALLYRLSMNLTYFQQPTNYVPLTTLELNAAAYTNDIASAISILYLQAVVHSDTQTIANQVSALQAQIQNAQNDIAAKSALITGYVNTIDALNGNAQNLQQGLANLQAQAQADEAEVQQQAQAALANQALQQKSSLFSDITRAVAGVAALTPFTAPFAPILNAVNTVVTDASSTAPWSALTGLSTLLPAISNFTVTCSPGYTVTGGSSGSGGSGSGGSGSGGSGSGGSGSSAPTCSKTPAPAPTVPPTPAPAPVVTCSSVTTPTFQCVDIANKNGISNPSGGTNWLQVSLDAGSVVSAMGGDSNGRRQYRRVAVGLQHRTRVDTAK